MKGCVEVESASAIGRDITHLSKHYLALCTIYAFVVLDLIYSLFPRSTTSSSPSVRRGHGVRGVKSIRDSELYCPPRNTYEQSVEEDNTTNGLPPPPPVHGKGASQGQSGQPREREDQATACAARRMDSDQSLSISIHGPVFTDEPREGEVKTNQQPPTKCQKCMAIFNLLCACRH